MSSKKKSISTQHARGAKERPRKRVTRVVGKSAEIENLVRAGVERFILKDSTIADFMKTIRAASKKEYVYSHQLGTARFLQIVKEATQKRNRQLKSKTKQ